MQRAPATPARPPLTPRPQSPPAQQPPPAYGPGQRPNYSPPGTMPQGGIPIPRAVPVAASAAQMPAASPPMPTSPYPQQAVPSAPRGEIPATKKKGFPGFITALFIIIVLVFVGGGIYYFINQAETPSQPITIADITPLSIQSGPSSSSITETEATIKWVTNEPATSQVQYGKTKTYGSETPEDTDLSTSHSVTLTELDPGTTYYFKVTSMDAAGNQVTGGGEFTTLAIADETPPMISGVGVSNITESSATITWATNEPATSQVQYGKTETYGSKTAENTNLITNHTVTLNGLDDGTTYYFQAISKDSSGNTATSDNQTFETTAAIPVGYEIGNRAPEFTLNDLNGNEVNLSDFRGKIVVVNFWATWCIPCMDELPYFQTIYDSDDWSGKVEILAIAVKTNETLNVIRQYVTEEAEVQYTFNVLFDSNGDVQTLYGLTDQTYIPRTFFIDAEGIIREIQEESFGSQAEIEDILNTLQP
jgi:peroxiredoxin